MHHLEWDPWKDPQEWSHCPIDLNLAWLAESQGLWQTLLECRISEVSLNLWGLGSHVIPGVWKQPASLLPRDLLWKYSSCFRHTAWLLLLMALTRNSFLQRQVQSFSGLGAQTCLLLYESQWPVSSLHLRVGGIFVKMWNYVKTVPKIPSPNPGFQVVQYPIPTIWT